MRSASGTGRALRRPPFGPIALNSGAGLLLVVLAALAASGPLGMAVALLVALTVLSTAVLGPELLGSVVMVAALGFAPLNGVHAPGFPSFLTVTDLLFVAGTGLLVPRLLVGKPQMGPTYKAGALLLVATGLMTGLLTSEGVLSVLFFARLLFAAVFMPVVIALWQPRAPWVRAMAWAYVLGQVVSDLYGVAHTGLTQDSRALGLTDHPNYFALAGQTALALLIYLCYQTPRKHRWLLVVAAAICAHSVYISGSRASLVCVALVLVLWPMLERSTLGWFSLVSGSLIVLTFASVVISNAQPGSALYRLKGGGSAQGSDEDRTMQIHEGIRRFWDHPLTGNGFSNVFTIHNVYLQMAVAAGVLAVVAFVLIMVALMRPVLSNPPNRLAYVGISYAAIAFLGPVMWDRMVWAPLALVFARSAVETHGPSRFRRRDRNPQRPVHEPRNHPERGHETNPSPRSTASRGDLDRLRERAAGAHRHRTAHAGARGPDA